MVVTIMSFVKISRIHLSLFVDDAYVHSRTCISLTHIIADWQTGYRYTSKLGTTTVVFARVSLSLTVIHSDPRRIIFAFSLNAVTEAVIAISKAPLLSSFAE